MKRLLSLLALGAIVVAGVYAQSPGRQFPAAPPQIEELDGDPSGRIRRLRVDNDSLTDQGGGVFALTTAIAPGSVTSDKLATPAVDTPNIFDSAVTSQKLEDDSVTTSKVKDDSITSEKVLNGSITTSKLNGGHSVAGALNQYEGSILVGAQGITTQHRLSLGGDLDSDQKIRFPARNTSVGDDSGGLIWQSYPDNRSAEIVGENENNFRRLGLVFKTQGQASASAQPVERMRITSSGRVGIGVSAPSVKLDIDGGAKLSGGVETSGKLFVQNDSPIHAEIIANGSNQSGTLRIAGSATNRGGRLKLSSSGDEEVAYILGGHNDKDGIIIRNKAEVDVFAIDDEGDVIIGDDTTTDRKLLVEGTARIVGDLETSGKLSAAGGLEVDGDTNPGSDSRGTILLDAEAGNTKRIYFKGDTARASVQLQRCSANGSDCALYMNVTESLMTFNDTNLDMDYKFVPDDPSKAILYLDSGLEFAGIGTLNPATKLHMSSGTLTIDGAGGHARIIGDVETSGKISAQPSSGEAMQLTGVISQWTGRMTGANSPGSSFGLLVQAGRNSSDSAIHVLDGTGGSTIFEVQGDGHVGIGTDSPDSALHVVGSIQTSGKFVGDGSSLTGITVGDSAITTAKIAPDAVTSGAILNASVTTDKLGNGSVTQEKLGPGLSLPIGDGDVTTAKLASDAVTSVKVSDGAITTSKVADGSITTSKFAPGIWTEITNNKSFGHVYITTATAANTTITTAFNFVKVGGTCGVHDLVNFTEDSECVLTYNGPSGRFFIVSVAISAKKVDAGASNAYFRLGVNGDAHGTESFNHQQYRYIPNNTDVGAISLQDGRTLNNGDTIALYISTDDADDLRIEAMTFNVIER